MDKLEKKIANIEKMQKHLQRSLAALKTVSIDKQEFLEDSVAVRYKMVIEMLWKILAAHLQDLGVEFVSSPRDTIKKAYELTLLTDEEQDLFWEYIKLRNLASHVYDEVGYKVLIEAAPKMLDFSKKIMQKIKSQ